MKTLVMGVGGAGTNILKALTTQPNWTRMAVNTDIESLEQSGIEQTLTITPLPFDEQVFHAEPWQGVKLGAEAARAELEAALSGHQRLVVITGLGGLAGTGIAPYVATLGQQLGLHVWLVAVLPFAFEAKRRELAARALEQIKLASTPMYIFNNESLMQINPSPSINEGFAQMTQHIEKTLTTDLASSTSHTPEPHRQLVLDTETTGLAARDGHRIIEIGCVELIDGKRTGNNRHWYLNPERNIDQGAFEAHGISQKFLADKPTFAEIVDDLLGFIKGAELVVHNAP